MITNRKFKLACGVLLINSALSLLIKDLGMLTVILAINATIFGLYLGYNVKVKGITFKK